MTEGVDNKVSTTHKPYLITMGNAQKRKRLAAMEEIASRTKPKLTKPTEKKRRSASSLPVLAIACVRLSLKNDRRSTLLYSSLNRLVTGRMNESEEEICPQGW